MSWILTFQNNHLLTIWPIKYVQKCGFGHVTKSNLCSTHSPCQLAWNLERKYTFNHSIPYFHGLRFATSNSRDYHDFLSLETLVAATISQKNSNTSHSLKKSIFLHFSKFFQNPQRPRVSFHDQTPCFMTINQVRAMPCPG